MVDDIVLSAIHAYVTTTRVKNLKQTCLGRNVNHIADIRFMKVDDELFRNYDCPALCKIKAAPTLYQCHALRFNGC